MARDAAARRTAKQVLAAVVSAGVLAYIVHRVGAAEIVGALSGARLAPLGVALVLYLAGQLASAGKWALLGRAVGLGVPLSEYVALYFVGMFFNIFGPSTLGGDLVRGLYLGESTGRRVLALNSVLFDRLSGLALLMGVGAVALVLFPRYRLPGPLAKATVAGGLVLVGAWWVAPRLARLLPSGHRVRRAVLEDLAPFWRDPRLLSAVAAVSVAFHLSQVLVQFAVSRALGLEVPLSYCLILHPLVSLASALPVSLAGFGVREGSYLYLLAIVGVPASSAVAFGLLWFVLSVVGALPGGALFLARGLPVPGSRAPADCRR